MELDDERDLGQRDMLFPRMYTIDDLVQQRMDNDTYQRYKEYHSSNQRQLKNSKNDPVLWKENVTKCKPIGFHDDPKYKNLPYGTSTLSISGCGPFCIAQALNLPVPKVTQVLSEQGYYCEGRGTWHMAFDRLGAKECNHIGQIAKAISEHKIVTILDNGHFRNIIGGLYSENKQSYYFVIADSNFERTYYEKKEDTFDKILSAWVWEIKE